MWMKLGTLPDVSLPRHPYHVSTRRCARSKSWNREEDTLCPQRRKHDFEQPSSLLLPPCCCSRSSTIRISRISLTRRRSLQHSPRTRRAGGSLTSLSAWALGSRCSPS